MRVYYKVANVQNSICVSSNWTDCPVQCTGERRSRTVTCGGVQTTEYSDCDWACGAMLL